MPFSGEVLQILFHDLAGRELISSHPLVSLGFLLLAKHNRKPEDQKVLKARGSDGMGFLTMCEAR